MRLLLAAGLVLLPGTAAPAQPVPPPALTAAVTRSGGAWTVELSLPRPARAWVFARSPTTEQGNRPWRQPRWTVMTPGVRLERHGVYDALVGINGRPVPAHVRIRFTPPSERMAGDYDPALVFSDGAVALYSKQFDAFPTDDVAAIARLQAGADLPRSVARSPRPRWRWCRAGYPAATARRGRSRPTLPDWHCSANPVRPRRSTMLQAKDRRLLTQYSSLYRSRFRPAPRFVLAPDHALVGHSCQ